MFLPSPVEMGFLHTTAGRTLWVRELGLLGEAQRRADVPPHGEEPAEVAQHPFQVPPGSLAPGRGVPYVPSVGDLEQEAELCLSAGLAPHWMSRRM